MLAAISTVFSAVGAKLFAVFGIAASALGLFVAVRHSGVTAQQNADLKKSMKNVETANAATTAVARESDAAVIDELRRDFSRD